MKKTALYDIHKKYNGKLVEFAGHELPIQFSGIMKEHDLVRTGVGLFDVSHMGEFEVTGKEAQAFCHYLVTNSVEGLENSQICYTPMCTETGGIVDDLLVYKFNEEKFWLVVNAANIEKDFAHAKKIAEKFDCELKDISDDISQIAIQGPKAQETMQKLVNFDLTELGYYYFKEIDLVSNVILSRTGYTGEDGFEVYCKNEVAAEIFEKMMEAGKEFEISPIGLGARDTLRLEAKLMLYGNDIDETTNPFSAKLKWAVKMDKEDFYGKDALVKIKEDGLKEVLVGFEMIDKGIARHGYEVYKNEDEKIGYITSGTSSPTLKKSLGLMYVKKGNGKVGTEHLVKIRNKFKKIKVIKTPFYKGSVNPGKK